MADNNPPNALGLNNLSPTVIAAGVGAGLILAAVVVAYLRSQNNPQTKVSSALDSAKSVSWPSVKPGNMKRKWMLAAAIKMIENDTSRRVLLTALKALAKRA